LRSIRAAEPETHQHGGTITENGKIEEIFC